MGRNGMVGRLAERFDVHGIPSPTASVVEAVAPIEVRREETLRLEERARAESGAVTSYFDPSAFDWLRPGGPMIGQRQPGVRFQKLHLVIWEIPQLQEWQYAQIGVTPRAIAFRRALAGNGWLLKREPKAKYATTFRMSMPKGLLERLEQDGWPIGQTLPAVWDARNEMVVVVRPAEAKGRRAG